jgi:hypothetical protein
MYAKKEKSRGKQKNATKPWSRGEKIDAAKFGLKVVLIAFSGITYLAGTYKEIRDLKLENTQLKIQVSTSAGHSVAPIVIQQFFKETSVGTHSKLATEESSEP